MKRPGIHIVIGKNFGDEGKGLAVDYFAMRAREAEMPCLVIRYNGGAQALVGAGQTDDGTMEYAPGTPEGASGPYSSAIPTGADAGDYVVWYRVKGDDNHKNSEAEAVGV